MIYLFLVVLLLIPIAILIGLISAYRKLPLQHFLMLLTVLLGFPYLMFKVYERSFMLSAVPEALAVTTILYSKEESWDFCSRSNLGIWTYPLPETIAQKIEQHGITFLQTMPANRDQASRDWHGRYNNWRETPILANEDWQPRQEDLKLDIYDYICRYGFCIAIDPEVVKEAATIINSPGSYYAYGRIGLIVVSPKNRKVLYMYNG